MIQFKRHWLSAVLVCVALNMLDGFDVLVISIVSPLISAEWHLDGQQLGELFSAGVAGMVLGSVGLAPLADRFGRRRIVLMGIVLVAVGMGLSAACRVYEELILCRFFAGLGIGGILSCAMVLVSEYAPDNRKSTASFLYTAGYSFGATLGGALAASAAQQWGWRVAFACGALGSVLLFPVAFAFLPESDSYRRAAASKFDFQACRSPREWAGPAVLLRQQAGMTLLLWVAFFLAYAGYYFVVSWTPKILVLGGLSTQAGMNAGVLLSLGGLGGTLLFALLGGRVPVRWLLLGCLASSALAMLIFPEVAQGTSLAFGAAIILGATTTNAMASFYALTPRLYGPLVRSAGMGWAVGVGRIGAIAAPFAAGILLDAGWTTAVLFRLFGIFLGLAALVSQLLPGDRVEGLAATHPTDAARDLAR